MSSSNKVDKSSDTPDIGVGLPTEPTNTPMIDYEPNPYRGKMPTTMMSRKAFSKAGKPAVIQLNSHVVEQWPTIDVFQYDVSLFSVSTLGSARTDQSLIDHRRKWCGEAWSQPGRMGF